ncbi:MAG TPA: endonuclease domain-containing protein [Caulobacteraceae bacterium]
MGEYDIPLEEKQDIVEFAQTLRREATLPERMLWNRLRGRQLAGLKFRRQHPFDPYVLDFYCPEVKLCVEVDGDWTHGSDEQGAKDQRRDAFLKSHGIRIVRIPAADVLQSLDEVMLTIHAAVGR